MIHTQDADFTLLNCDVLDGLRSLADGSVHCVVTSPPYWGLRDYGTGEWEGGDPGCSHATGRTARNDGNRNGEDGFAGNRNLEGAADMGPLYFRDVCGKCGARRVDQQLGLEPTPDLYVQRMVEVFREVRRVLRDDGTCWVNLGDCYWSDPSGFAGGSEHLTWSVRGAEQFGRRKRPPHPTLKQKDLAGMPWRVAFALQADGWYLRSDIIWAKPNPMPESVTDRPTKAHEYVFLLSKSPRYFFDQEAVREPAIRAGDMPGGDNGRAVDEFGVKPHAPFNGTVPAGRNVRSVWEIATQPYPEAHFATYPEELVRRCVLAGTSERGCCPVCGKPWERQTETEYEYTGRNEKPGRLDGKRNEVANFASGQRALAHVTTLGWTQRCDHDADPIPCTVLDPFLGSGTTAHVARKHGRRSIGVELNAAYCDLAARRMQQQSLFA